MKRWGVLFLALVTLAACNSATGSLYGDSSTSSGGGGSGGNNNSGPPWHVTYAVDAVHENSPPTDSTAYADGDSVTVMTQGNLTWGNFPFKGWTTKDPGYNGIGDNGGTHYNPGDKIEIHSNIKLWAAWANP